MHAKEAEIPLFSALSNGADPETVGSLLLGSELLDYAGEKFQTPLDMLAVWNKLGGERPDPATWWNEWESQVTHYPHPCVMEITDHFTDLEAAYRAEWQKEYACYRLGSALGRWDAEYQY
jgi:hypothetical protein